MRRAGLRRGRWIAMVLVAAGSSVVLFGGCPADVLSTESVEPTSGPTAGGTKVTIRGRDFHADSGVLFGGIAATEYAVINDQLITATTPAHAAGAVDVQVMPPGPTGGRTVGQFEYLAEDTGKETPEPGPEPTVLGVTTHWPSEGPLGGGTLVTIEGENFVTGTAVFFGAAAATEAECINRGLMTVRTPPGDAGTVDMRVQHPDRGTVVCPGAFTYVGDVLAEGMDSDGDGLSDAQEMLGYEIRVDEVGFGMDPRFLTVRAVTSDPHLADTDGDGVDDRVECINRCDPRRVDTDGDGLHDAEELERWRSSPVSVDSDSDARGPDSNLPPNVSLFDGQELYTVSELGLAPEQRVLRAQATSPTLDDTDGDGRTDGDEYDDPVHSTLVADLPQLAVRVVDDVDIRLDVTYAEDEGQERQYGTEFATSTSTSQSNYRSDTVSESLSIGVSHEFGLFGGTTVSAEVTIGGEHTWATTTESSQSAEQAYSQYVTDARTRTETAASGSILMGVEIENLGSIAFTLTDLAFTVRQWQPGAENGDPAQTGSFKTMAQLTPDLGDGVSLAPGTKTPVIAVQATDVNVDRVKAFLARPDSLYLEPAAFELKDAEGFNFAFINEVTFARTARIVIDFGNGESEEYRVATNVDRAGDSSFRGLRLGTALGDILGISFETRPRQELDPGGSSNERVLVRVRDADTSLGNAPSFWVVRGTGFGAQAERVDFEEAVLHAGDEVLMFYCSDPDGDGLYGTEEQHYGSSDALLDTDGDGLKDAAEVRSRYIDENGDEVEGGWEVAVAGCTSYHVFSDPGVADQDEDGLNDAEEKAAGTDPTKPDTDGDGLPESSDPFPTIPARVFRVSADASAGGDGSSWDSALSSLDDALGIADMLNQNTDPSDDVSEIWVAAGSYTPSDQYFTLVPRVAVYGGFAGIEDKLSQRSDDPVTNGTALAKDGVSGPIVVAPADPEVPLVLDGFLIQGVDGGASALRALQTDLRVANCFFYDNVCGTQYHPGGAACIQHGTVEFDNCTFASNRSTYSGADGGAVWADATDVRFKKCNFVGNEIPKAAEGGEACGAAVHANDATVSFVDCRFENNSIYRTTDHGHGGAVALVGWTYGSFRDCVFAGNQVDSRAAGSCCLDYIWCEHRAGGAVAVQGGATMAAVNCVFLNNRAEHFGGGVYVQEGGVAHLVQCTFHENDAYAYGVDDDCLLLYHKIIYQFGVGGAVGCRGLVNADNCILWGNTARRFEYTVGNAREREIAPAAGSYHLLAPFFVSGGTVQLNNSCVANGNVAAFAGSLPGVGIIASDPLFAEPTLGNLTLGSNSPCIDAGDRFVDADPGTPGFQALPETDLAGNPRIVDGNGDAVADVDMGAFEYQP